MAKTMTTQRKLNKRLYAAGLLLCILCVFVMSVFSVSAAESGSLTLRCVFSAENGERVLSGDEYSIVKIADVEAGESIVSCSTLPSFKSYDCDWLDQTASKMNEKAKALAYYCEKNSLYTDKQTTDTKGELTFDGLEIGLYLVSRTMVDPQNEDFITDPLLVFVPQYVNGEMVYDVVSRPKFSYLSPVQPDDPDSPERPSDTILPQTGQLMWPITVLAVVGCFLILGGSTLLRKRETDET